MTRYVLLVAGGSGSRMGADVPKQFLRLPDDTPILVKTFRAFADLPHIRIIVVLPETHIPTWQSLATEFDLPEHQTVAGGATRTASVAAGMTLVPDEALVAVHDGVRPFVSAALIEASYAAAAQSGAACAAVPSKDSLRRRLPDGSSQAVPREEYYLVQTPQTFGAGLWKQAYAAAPADAVFTDDASLVEASGHPITLVEGSYANLKITTPEDLPRS